MIGPVILCRDTVAPLPWPWEVFWLEGKWGLVRLKRAMGSGMKGSLTMGGFP